jgi:putative peptidoglycan binding protein
VPERVATADSDYDNEGGLRSLLSRALGRYPRDMIAIFVAIVAAGMIFINALYRQPGPHPAPIFAIKPRPVAVETTAAVKIAPHPRAEATATGQKTEAPVLQKLDAMPRPRVEPVRIETTPIPKPKPDAIAALIGGAPAPAATPTPPSKVVLVQRALNDFGYGPVKSSGNVGPDTTAAIQKFERERKLPVTGQISPRLLRELAAVTGRVLD